MKYNGTSADSKQQPPFPTPKLSEYFDPWFLPAYFVPWLLVPRFGLGTQPFSENTYSSGLGFASFLIVVVSFFTFGKWFLLYKLIKEKGSTGGGGGKGPPWNKLLWTFLMILLSYLAYKLFLELADKEINLFDRATLWSTVYGSIFGTFSYLKANQLFFVIYVIFIITQFLVRPTRLEF